MDLHASKKRKSWGVRGLVASLTTLQLLQFPGCTALASANVTASTPYVDTPNPAEADLSRDEALRIGTQIVQALVRQQIVDIKPTIDLCAEHGTLVRKALPLDAQLHLASWLFIHGTTPERAGNNVAACFRNLAPLRLSHMGASDAFTKSQQLSPEDAKMYEAYFGLPATFVLYNKLLVWELASLFLGGEVDGESNYSLVSESDPDAGPRAPPHAPPDVAPQVQEGPLSVLVPPRLGEWRWHQIYASGTAFDVYPRFPKDLVATTHYIPADDDVVDESSADQAASEQKTPPKTPRSWVDFEYSRSATLYSLWGWRMAPNYFWDLSATQLEYDVFRRVKSYLIKGDVRNSAVAAKLDRCAAAALAMGKRSEAAGEHPPRRFMVFLRHEISGEGETKKVVARVGFAALGMVWKKEWAKSAPTASWSPHRALSEKSHWREWEGEVEGERVPECEWVFPVDEDVESGGGGNPYRKAEL